MISKEIRRRLTIAAGFIAFSAMTGCASGAPALTSSEAPTPVTRTISTAEPSLTPFISVAPQKKDQAECNLMTLDQVKKGIIKPQDYIQKQYECLPEAVEAEKSGILKRFIYQPSDIELESILTELFSSRTDDEETLRSFVQASIGSYKSLKGEHVGTIVSGIVGVFGEKVPVYIAFTEKLFSSPAINNEADVRSAVEHELQHVEDWYYGITLGNVHLAYDTISQKTFSVTFLEQLMELRAEYRVLEDIFREKVDTGKISVSPEWFGSQAKNYSEHFNYVKQYPATDLEKKVKELQLQEFAGITPEKTTNSLLIKFDLFEKQNTAVFEGSVK